MIDKTTGAFLLDSGERVDPRESFDDFTASPLGQRGTTRARGNALWRDCTLHHCVSQGKRWGLVLTYEGQRLHSLRPWHEHGPTTGSGWGSWSLANEQAAVAEHDAIVTSWLGPRPWSFPWGTVSSSFDERGGSAVLMVRYT